MLCFYDDDPACEHYVFVSVGMIFWSFLIWMKPQSSERKIELDIISMLIVIDRKKRLTYFLCSTFNCVEYIVR